MTSCCTQTDEKDLSIHHCTNLSILNTNFSSVNNPLQSLIEENCCEMKISVIDHYQIAPKPKKLQIATQYSLELLNIAFQIRSITSVLQTYLICFIISRGGNRILCLFITPWFCGKKRKQIAYTSTITKKKKMYLKQWFVYKTMFLFMF